MAIHILTMPRPKPYEFEGMTNLTNSKFWFSMNRSVQNRE